MKEIIFVTGNDNKFKEIVSEFPEFNLKREKIDLDEIQSLDIVEVNKYKLKQAYEKLKCPVMVDDTSFEIDALNGLPGTFIKFFEQKLGQFTLSKLIEGKDIRGGSAICSISYYDGQDFIIGLGEVRGEILRLDDLRLEFGEGFGFDFCFIPEEYDKTFAQLGLEVKKKISHRALAIKNFKEKYKEKFK